MLGLGSVEMSAISRAIELDSSPTTAVTQPLLNSIRAGEGNNVVGGTVNMIVDNSSVVNPSNTAATTTDYQLESLLRPGSEPQSQAMRSEELLGLTWMALSALCFSSMSLLVNIGGTQEAYRIPSLEMVFSRSLIQALLAAGYLLCRSDSLLGPPDKSVRLFLALRGATGSLGLAAFFVALTSLPLADATVIFFTGPPITAVLAYWALHESLSKLDILAVACCFLGVGLVARPQFLFHDDDNDVIVDDATGSRALGISAALFGACMSAVAYVLVRYITTRLSHTVNAMVHVLYFGVISTFASSIAMFVFQDPIWPRTSQQWTLLLSVGVLAFGGQVLLNRGLQLAPAGPGVMMRNLDVVFAFLFSILLLDQWPKWTSFVGATLIVGFAVLTGSVRLIQQRQQR